MKTIIIGNSGSGKTTLARAINKVTGREIIHLDRYYWKEGWTRTPREEWEAFQKELVQKDSWIIEGFHITTIDIRLEAADTIIVLDPPAWLCVLRVLLRVVKSRFQYRPDLPNGLKEKFDLNFLHWIWIYPTGDRKVLNDKISKLSGKNVIYLRSGRDIARFISQLNPS